MSRLTPITKRQEFKDQWIDPSIDRFSHWVKYLDVSIKFFKKHYDEIDEQVKKFDEVHGNEVFENPFDGSVTSFDGIDLYYDEYQHTERAESEVIPLVLIGVYTHFESTLKQICQSFKRFKPNIEKFKGKYIESCKTYIENAINLLFCDELCDLWTQIDRYRELRNIFAHNDNPISKDKEDRFLKVSNINDVNIENRYITVENEKPVLEFISLCDKFIFEVVNEIASKIEE